jgi:hypothetical protein
MGVCLFGRGSSSSALSKNQRARTGRYPKIPQIKPAHLPSCLPPLPLPLPPLAPLLYSALACGACYGSVWRKDSTLASVLSPPAGEEKQEAAPVRHCKGVNDLDKVMLREVRGISAEVPVCHSHKSPAMFRLSRAALQRYSSVTPTSHRACSGCQIPA